MAQQPVDYMIDITSDFVLKVTKHGIDPYGDPDHCIPTEGYEIRTGKPYIRVKYSASPFIKSDFVVATPCDVCSKFLANPKRCSQCKNRNYCSKGCQKLDWILFGAKHIHMALFIYIDTSNSYTMIISYNIYNHMHIKNTEIIFSY